MLVISRYENDRVVIDDRIILQVLEIRGNRVRLGFQAPRGIPIHREETMSQSSVWKAEEEARGDDDDQADIGGEGVQP